MNCLKCGREIPNDQNRLCETCSPEFLSKPSSPTNESIQSSPTEGASLKTSGLPEQKETTEQPTRPIPPPSSEAQAATQTKQTPVKPPSAEQPADTTSSAESSKGGEVFFDKNEASLKPTVSKRFTAKKIALASLIAIILLGVFGTGTLVFASYLNWQLPLVPKSVMRFVDGTIAAAPLIPKTPKQILTRALFETNEIKTAYQKASFKSSYSSGSPSEQFELLFDFEGPFDATKPEVSKYKADFKGSFKLGTEKFDFKLGYIQINNDSYFKLEKAPDVLQLYGFNFSPIYNKWYKFDYANFQDQLSTTSKSEEETIEEMEEQLDKFLEIAEERKLLQKFEMLSDQKIGDEDSYHLKLRLTGKEVGNVIRDLYREFGSSDAYYGTAQDIESLNQITKYLKSTTLELWVTKKDFIVNKVEFNSDLIISSAAYGGSYFDSSITMNFQFSYSIEQINKAQKIEAPASFKEIKDPTEFLEKIYSPQDSVYYNQQTSVLGIATLNIPADALIIPGLLKAIYSLGPAINSYEE